MVTGIKPRVLAIDDELGVLRWLARVLEDGGYEVQTTTRGSEATAICKSWTPAVVLLDLVLPDADGLDLLRRIKRDRTDVEVVMVTGHGSVSKAVEAMKAGAYSFVEKPVEPAALLATLERAVERQRLEFENEQLRQELKRRFTFANIVGKSKRVRDILALLKRIAPTDANVLIAGESGTGKELVANAVHSNSTRASAPFVKINCAAIPKDLIEAELFGYRKGAFTGATTDRQGLFAGAHGGSLLLDEIGEMPPHLQTKLLRVLQEREFRPLGTGRVEKADFRLICATNLDLDTALHSGKLREDLYFRINTITVRVPPLRERGEDIPLLSEHFLQKYRVHYQRTVLQISATAYEVLLRYHWPGNVRELENAIQRGVLVAESDEIQVEDLPESVRGEMPRGKADLLPDVTLAELEKQAIVQALNRTNWNKQEAAQRLGLYRQTLYAKIKRHAIEGRRPGAGALASSARRGNGHA